ncbi:hypothetical protein JNUCC0626_22115 [Lentzea sp. JNUCC 0626]|uniref:hypothetical protein n=1 Tax=Lentzea sp. JNUCC 0626 TaxID=3367513 RepID=UPI003748E416
MSEAPTHAAGVPTPARPQHTPQQTPQQSPQQPERMPQQAQRVEAQHAEAQRIDAQRTDAQRTDAQRADAQKTETQKTEHQRTEPQRTEQRHAEPQRSTESRSIGKLEDEWQAVQYDFVDDPKSAVRKADDLVTRALEELTSRHRSLTKQLEGNSDPQTEDLRLALHRYRELFKSLVAVK